MGGESRGWAGRDWTVHEGSERQVSSGGDVNTQVKEVAKSVPQLITRESIILNGVLCYVLVAPSYLTD